MRIGYGFDSHEFRPGIPLKIGGIVLPHDKGLGGHSDGDVLLHAITDALLGAVAAPDIGALFPPSDPKWKGADSDEPDPSVVRLLFADSSPPSRTTHPGTPVVSEQTALIAIIVHVKPSSRAQSGVTNSRVLTESPTPARQIGSELD